MSNADACAADGVTGEEALRGNCDAESENALIYAPMATGM